MSEGEARSALFGALDPDPARDLVASAFQQADPDGRRAARVFRSTFDQLYDGQHTGRYRWEQLFKTEKTHYGTLLEINLRREFDDVIDDGALLDYQVLNHDIDCKYSQTLGGWMLPPECFGHLLLVATASDTGGTWSLGVVRASDENRRRSENRDGKTGLNKRGRTQIAWLHFKAELPPNILLSLDQETIDAVLAPKSGQAKVTELLRRVGYLIPGGDYEVHRSVARKLGIEVPEPGEVVSVRVVPTTPGAAWTVELDGATWRAARDDEQVTTEAPRLPETKKTAQSSE